MKQRRQLQQHCLHVYVSSTFVWTLHLHFGQKQVTEYLSNDVGPGGGAAGAPPPTTTTLVFFSGGGACWTTVVWLTMTGAMTGAACGGGAYPCGGYMLGSCGGY